MKLKILFMSSGPIMSIESDFYTNLSNYFDGCVVTSSGNPKFIKTKSIHGFPLRCFRYDYKKSAMSRITFILNSLFLCFKMRVYREKIDLVVSYDPLMTGIISLLCSKLLNGKFACEVNGVYTSRVVFADEKSTFKTRLAILFYPKLEAFVLRRAHGIKLLFPGQLDPFQGTLGKKVIRAFPCHVDINPFLNYNCPEEKKEILFVGFPFKLKGVDILIKAFMLISEKHKDWKLKILGWFPENSGLKDAMENHPRIEHHPPVFFRDIPKHICTCGIFVLPSRSEAMGRVLVEAMAAGKPRIGSNIEGIPTVIKDGVDGLLFEGENVEDLALKLDLLIDNPELRKRLGEAGRNRAQMEFNNKTFFFNLNDFYHDVLKQIS